MKTHYNYFKQYSYIELHIFVLVSGVFHLYGNGIIIGNINNNATRKKSIRTLGGNAKPQEALGYPVLGTTSLLCCEKARMNLFSEALKSF